ncbi:MULTISPECIES: aminotransferase class V-fold PLP-dependent enzyme [Alkalimonas]|uniref:Aminotransferase class V-fold PLP-dependent enzyme n=1 Tax=Alkalimonas mucilaginosa TaxID=3057676 RepID=A0ABU7JE97_9GAMM|nr:aminotransferase class V-fold PLP-dependent enzyme [Alkalimonas sp. MEB004]MEE2023994.1 aminotransferase class V-fold PLP-dependent enzyme [Alkalimonas sp. MEB004]
MYQHLYQHFLQGHQGKQHFASHSHHFWPDVTRQAMLDYWDLSARCSDEKWQTIFAEVLPQTQRLLAAQLGSQQPEQLVFAPNTHELVMRLLSCFDWRKPIRVLTTDSEFYSFQRQVSRMQEDGLVELTVIPTEPFADFEQRFIAAANSNEFELIFCSQVFFNSGVAIADLTDFVQQLAAVSQAMIAIDGYHAFMALPLDVSAIESRIFYLAGSYKYAQAGEGCCFMLCPKGNQYRPVYTGWFAEFGALAQQRPEQVPYSTNGFRFAGATMDYSALYRLRAVLLLLQQEQLTVPVIHRYVQQLQQVFLQQLRALVPSVLNETQLLQRNLQQHGHFLTFALPTADDAAAVSNFLKQHHILTDYRGNRLRFGFAMYQCADQFDLGCLALFSTSS